MNGYAVIIDTRTDRELTFKQMDMLTVSLRGASICCDVTARRLQFRLCVDAPAPGAAVTEALKATGKAARVAGFSYGEPDEIRVLPYGKLEAQTLRLLADSDAVEAPAPGAPE